MKKLFNLHTAKDIALGFLCGASPLASGIYPFGVGLLCGKEGNVIYCGIGALIALLTVGRAEPITLISLLYTVAIRLLFRSRKHTVLRTFLLSAAYSALLGIKIYAQNLFYGEGAVRAVCIALLPPMFAFTVFLASKGKWWEYLYMLVCGLVICRVFSEVYVYSFPVSVAVAVALTAVASKEKGFPFSGAAGFVYGLSAPVFSLPVVGIFGLVCGLFFSDAPFFALLMGYMLSVTAGAYVCSFDGIIPIAVSALAGVLVFLPFIRYRRTVKSDQLQPQGDLYSLAAGFSALSGVFFTMSDKGLCPPGEKTYTAVKEKLDSLCENCTGCLADKNQLALSLAECCGREGTAVIPDELKTNCPYYKELTMIPIECLAQSASEIKDTFQSFGAEYRCFSNMLAATARKAEEEAREDTALVPAVEDALNENGIYFQKVRVTGTRMRKVEIFGVSPDSIRISSGEFSRIVARAVGRCLSAPEFVCCGEKTTAVFNTVPALRTESVKLVAPREGQTLSGDTVNLFESARHCFYSLVADGMGSGGEANTVSRLASMYLEKMISSGGDMNSALLLLGDTLSRSPGETFTTVDILEADRVLARGRIVKAGAPPSFLIRGGKQYVIKSPSTPLGIIKEVAPKQISFSLKRGDIILMVSDGVDTSPSAISKSFSSSRDLNECAAQLMSISRKKGSEDDMSVCAVRFY